MAIGRSKNRIAELRRAFERVDLDALCRSMQLDPAYPTLIWPVQAGDDFGRELLERARDDSQGDDLVADLELLRPRNPRDPISKSSAVYRMLDGAAGRDHVVQITRAKTTKS